MKLFAWKIFTVAPFTRKIVTLAPFLLKAWHKDNIYLEDNDSIYLEGIHNDTSHFEGILSLSSVESLAAPGDLPD